MTDTTPPNLPLLLPINKIGGILTVLTLIGAIVWAFPIYWGLVTTFKPEQDVVRPGIEFWPKRFTFEAYTHVLFQTKIGLWYINSLVTSLGTTVLWWG